MRRLCAVFTIGLLAGLSASSFLPNPAARAQAHKTEVVQDDETGAIRFLIDGTPVAQIDATGLYVRHDIAYGGASLDAGPAFIDDYFAGRSHAP